MDLNLMASAAVAAVLPKVPLTLRRSSGFTKNASFEDVPTYEPDVLVMGNVQPITWRDLQQLDGLNLQGTRVKIYFEGSVDAIERVSNKGGDLVIDDRGNVWLVAQVMEKFPDWCSVAATLQDGS